LWEIELGEALKFDFSQLIEADSHIFVSFRHFATSTPIKQIFILGRLQQTWFKICLPSLQGRPQIAVFVAFAM